MPYPRLRMKPLLLALGLSFAASAAWAQMPPPPPRMIMVSGDANEQIAPDQAILSLSLTTKETDLKEAKRKNDEMVEKLVKITKDFEIPKEKVATSGVTIQPQYTYPEPSNKPKFDGYMVSRSLRITMDKIDIHEKVLSAIVDAKINQVNGVEFGLAKPEEYASKVRVKAFENAKAKAQALAAAAGVKLGPVLNIAADGGSSAPRPPMPMMMAQAKFADREMSVAPSLPGLITLQESVSVSFALE